jgi:hypothetical protein
MKKVTRILVGMLVIASIAACGAGQRPDRSVVSQNSANALADQGFNIDANTVDYDLVVGTIALPGAGVASPYNEALFESTYQISPASLGIPIAATGATGIQIDLFVNQTSGTCGLGIAVGTDASGPNGTPDGQYDVYTFGGVITTGTAGSTITCNLVDGASTIQAIVTPVSTGATPATADVSIMNMTTSSFLVNMKPFTVGTATSN